MKRVALALALLAAYVVLGLLYYLGPVAELRHTLVSGVPEASCWEVEVLGEREARALGEEYGYEAVRVTGPGGEPGWHFIRRRP